MSETEEVYKARRQLGCDALRSGDYKQSVGQMTQSTPTGDLFCCLAVFTKVFVEMNGDEHDEVWFRLPEEHGGAAAFDPEAREQRVDLHPKVMEWFGFEGTNPQVNETRRYRGVEQKLTLMDLNDGHDEDTASSISRKVESKDFDYIAEAIEETYQ